MSDNKALATVAGTRLEAYGEREQVGEIVDRLMKLHPSANEVGLEGMRAAAQLAVMVGASPLPSTNEIHVWRQGQRVFVDLGINYFRRMRDELGGVLWETQPRQMRDEERAEHGISQGQLAALCRGIKVEDMVRFKKMGFSTNEVWRMSASTGIGVCGPNEAKNGRPAIWTAFKRAEKDLYRQLFPVMMNMTGGYVHTDEAAVIFEDRVDHVRVGERPADALPESMKDMSVDEVNELLFDGAIEGSFEEVEEIDYDAPPGIDEETGEIMTEPEQDDTAAFEQAIRAAGTFAEFYAACVEHVKRYEHTNAVKGVVKLLGVKISKDADRRVQQAMTIREYAMLRDAGMGQDDALASLGVNDREAPAPAVAAQEPLFPEDEPQPIPDTTYSE